MKTVDLHVHSDKSDGSMSPSELVDLALEKGLSAFALTDHDTTAGLSEAISYAAGKNIEVIPGIEFSTEYLGKDVHILGQLGQMPVLEGHLELDHVILKVGEGPFQKYLAMGQDAHMVAHVLQLPQVVGGHQHRGPPLGHVTHQQGPDLTAHHRV